MTTAARPRFLLLAALSALVLAGLACRDRTNDVEKPTPAPATPPPDPAAVSPTTIPAAPPSVSPPPPSTSARIRKLIAELTAQGGCSRLMGCPAAKALLREGDEAVPALLALLRARSGDSHWRRQLFDVLGRIGHPSAIEVLVERLSAPDERLTTDAALALGHMRAVAARDTLAARFAATSAETRPDLRLALAYALVRTGLPEPWQEIAVLGDPERIASLPTAVLETLLVVWRWQDARDSVPAIAAAIAHENVFVRRDAIRLALDWRLHEAIPALIARLEDESAGVRRLALEAMQRITRLRYKTTKAQWERWCRSLASCRRGLPAGPPCPAELAPDASSEDARADAAGE